MESSLLFPQGNFLPYDGELEYIGGVLDSSQEKNYREILAESLPWKQDEVVIYGKKILTPRKVVWFSDFSTPYKYSHTTKIPCPWTREMLELKELASDCAGVRFNSCLANYYHSGEEGMSWHADDETSLVKHGVIASLSLGAERRFDFKHKTTGEKLSINLEPGSLLLMKGEIQSHWLHSLPKAKKVKGPRINLTFRVMVQ